jgi:hypothetical protein
VSLPLAANSGVSGDLPDIPSPTKHRAVRGGPHTSPDLVGSTFGTVKKNQNLWRAA